MEFNSILSLSENEFPVSFESIVKKIHRLLFHVIAHLYHSHFRELVLLSLHAHLNCIFAHFTLFNERFRLIEEKETEILHDLVLALRLHPEDRDQTDSNSCPSNNINNSAKAQETLRHLTEAATGGGRTSPPAGCTPTEGVSANEPTASSLADQPQEVATTNCDDTPFISPPLAVDTKP